MTTEHTKESIKKSHTVGFKGLFAVASGKSLFFSGVNKIALCIAVLACALGLILNISQYEIISEVTNTLLSFLPGILGFTIAGFTLMVGFLQSDLIDGITERVGDSIYTLYQHIVSRFAMSVLVQSIALIIAYTFHFFMWYENKSTLVLPLSLERIINITAVFIIWYGFLLSVFIVCQVIINIFDFSQLHHFVIVKKKANLDKKGK